MKLYPESPEGNFVTGMLYFFYGFPKKTRNIRKIIFHFNRSLQIDPNNCEALFHLEVAYLFLGKTNNVDLLLKRHLSIDPLSFYGHWINSINQLFKGDFEQALTPIRTVYNIASEVPPMKYFYALILAYNNQLEESFAAFENTAESDPDNLISQLAVFLKFALS